MRETLDYVLRDMTAAEGGFYCDEDADSEGVEGKFYLWMPEEIVAVLGAERAKTFCRIYKVTGTGNFEGRNILHLANPIALAAKMLDRDADELEATLAKLGHGDQYRRLAEDTLRSKIMEETWEN